MAVAFFLSGTTPNPASNKAGSLKHNKAVHIVRVPEAPTLRS
jgi:hypothetical protein